MLPDSHKSKSLCGTGGDQPTAAFPQRLLAPILAAGLLATAVVVDPLAADAFDAPKWFVAQLTAATAFACLLWIPRSTTPAKPHRSALLAPAALAIALAALLLSSVLAPDRAASGEALRVVLLFVLLLPLGASRALDARSCRWLALIAGGAVAINAAVSLAQASGWQLPWLPPVVRVGGRYPTGALLGNEGFVAVACALAVPVAACWTLCARTSRTRAAALAVLSVCVLAIVVNRQSTAFVAAAVGGLVVLLARLRRTGLLRTLAIVGVLAVTTATLPLLRPSAWPAWQIDVERVQQLTTNRLGAWMAATGMWRERPWFGHGPGSFRQHAQHYRLDAEIDMQARLLPPVTASGFVQAHNEYLQLAAEAGLVALLAVLAALGSLVNGLLPRAATDAEAAALLGLLAAGAVAALAWFPLQIPFTAMLLLLAAGRGWRLIAEAAQLPLPTTARFARGAAQ